MDDSALLRLFAENQSDEAFAELATRHVNLVYSVALRHVGNQHQAEEITQAVFIILAKKAASLRHDKALSSWLFQTTRLTANNFVRSEMRRHRREQEAYVQSQLNEPSGEIWRQIAPLLDTAVANLNEQDRRAILLRFYEGRDLRQVGDILGANEEAAKKRVARAVEKLQRFFLKRGVDSTADVITGTIAASSIQIAPVTLAKAATTVGITKGAAGATSTLALARGALRIMAWAKAKTAIAISAGVLLAAGATTFTVQQIESHGTLTIRMHVDGSDFLKVSGNQLWLEHSTYLLPAKTIYVNGRSWSPNWNGNVSAKFHDFRPALHPRDPQKIKLSVATGRGTVKIQQLPAPDNDQTLSVLVDDIDAPGMDWYEFKISW